MRLEVEILTLFPRMCEGYLAESILGKAQEAGLLAARVTDIRDYAAGRHRVTDDAPYGGGAGMVMKPEPLTEAIEAARARLPNALVLLTSPRGARLDQALARRLAAHGSFVVACGRYEGVDERVTRAVDMEVSIGDVVLTGGELAAHYTRPPTYRGMQVPEVLLSGDHRRIERWRRREALRATRERRPDLFARARLTDADVRLIDAGDDEL